MLTKSQERVALLTGPQACAILGLSPDSLRRAVTAGALEQVRIAGLGWPRYRRADVEALVRGKGSP